MEASVKFLCLLGFVVIVGIVGGVNGAGECGSSVENELGNLRSCGDAIHDQDAPVSESCCLEAKKIVQDTSCLCAIVLSNTAKAAGMIPEVAITIPKRCNIADRPVGHQCGDYTLP
uniref:Protease inhibitor/seed storage/lipid transfer protein family protein n=1 Tax=Jatropha curcas TaxID=180498 RepID=D2D963_JATCU|nr:protease inhibitor/seed storage/lipid transfer protein family protein [Jatropha curcas]ADU56178.1 hypothetical protein [Jatropha curcas]